MKKIFFIIILISSFCYSQVGIGTTTPNGALDINSSTNGVIVPNVALTSRATSAPIVNPNGGGAPLDGTLVWNTATAGSSPNNVVPGFYFWDGSAWIAIAGDGGKNWTTSGNGGTTAGTNFIGTTDAVDFRIKTNATDRWNISNTNAGQLQSYSLGTASLPIYSFQSNTNTGLFSSSANNLDFSTNGTARFRIPNANQIHALSLGTAALPFYSFSADTGIGIWSPTTSTLAFSTAGTERMRIDNVGKVGIGGIPSTTLDIVATNPIGTSTNVDGILIPRVDRQRAQSMTGITTGTMIYVNSIATGTATGTTINVTAVGFYYFDGSNWIGMNNTTGQSATTVFSTGSLTVTSGFAFTLIPGLTTTISVPANCNVLVNADVGLFANSTSATGYSNTDIALLVDGALLTNGGYRKIYCVNNTANQNAAQQASISVSLTLSTGNHTFALYAGGGGSGTSSTVGGNNTTSQQGELTVTIIKK